MTAEGDDRTGASLRALPSVSALLLRAGIRPLLAQHGHAVVVEAIRAALDQTRRIRLRGGEAEVSEDDIARRADKIASGTLRKVFNATGVVVHTNLGRAPLAAEAITAVARACEGYSTLEYDLDE